MHHTNGTITVKVWDFQDGTPDIWEVRIRFSNKEKIYLFTQRQMEDLYGILLALDGQELNLKNHKDLV